MKNLGKRIERALPEIQPRVEEALEIKLGDVEVRPLSSMLNILKWDDPFKQLLALTRRDIFELVNFYLFPESLALAAILPFRSSVIFYSRSTIANSELDDIGVEDLTAHELAHLAYHRSVNNSKAIYNTPINLREGFAELVGRSVISKRYQRPYEEMFGPWNRSYDSELDEFKSLLVEHDVNPEDLRSVAKFMRTQTVA